ncbi:phytase [Hirschia litorea]|uniref:Phytase n=1 Tax=Hirschia litorea TaxID=1199156 RepID=A0ABW2IJD0_9PROT
MRPLFPLLASVACLALVNCAATPKYASDELLGVASVSAFAETPAVETSEDAADDPAIWVNPKDASQSLILGTNKQSGIYVYDLSGAQKQFLPVGRVNNVDVRSVQTANGVRHIAAASNRTSNTLTFMEINPETGKVNTLKDFAISEPEVYGYCLGVAKDGSLLSFVNTKTAKVLVHRIDLETLTATQIDSWTFGGQMEGCSNDDAAGILFLGEEEHGLWRVTHDNGAETKREIMDTIANDQGLVMDVEGVDIWHGDNGTGYVVVSAQAADRYVVYQREAPYKKVGIFNIKPSADGKVDGVSHTDGLAVSSAAFNESLSSGLLVVQDDDNTDPQGYQNFKLVNWKDVEKALELKK